jgi:soluble lytic murein transglycosylase-like protein
MARTGANGKLPPMSNEPSGGGWRVRAFCRLSFNAGSVMPQPSRRRILALLAIAPLAACSRSHPTVATRNAALALNEPPLHANETPALRRLIRRYADHYEVPSALVHRLAIRESRHRPSARNGPYYGLLQMLPQTARTMGHRGPPETLLDAETNLKYGVKYLRGAWLVAGGDPDAAIMWYARGYYYEAKRKGLLVETGLRSG